MKERSWGRIIHISSIMGLAIKDPRNSYSATKSRIAGPGASQRSGSGASTTSRSTASHRDPFLTDLPGTLLSPEQKKALADRTALGALGRSARIGRTGLAAGQRSGQLHHGRRAGRRRRIAGQDVLATVRPRTFQIDRNPKHGGRNAACVLLAQDELSAARHAQAIRLGAVADDDLTVPRISSRELTSRSAGTCACSAAGTSRSGAVWSVTRGPVWYQSRKVGDE